ncbi:hypothetical protein F511_06524, partial [Dorcoceras hygrometricum]
QAGLRLLLCPLGSNIVVRTACCSVGIVLPVYSTFKAIEAKDEDEQQKWLLYWAAYGSFSVAELFMDKFLYWVPLYYHMKFAFLVWLQLPAVDGARQLYMNHLRPFLRRHQPRLDQLVSFLYGEMAKFVSNHEAEIQFAKTLLVKVLLSGVLVNMISLHFDGIHSSAESCMLDIMKLLLFGRYNSLDINSHTTYSILPANDVVKEIIHPGQRRADRAAIAAPPETEDTSESEDEE